MTPDAATPHREVHPRPAPSRAIPTAHRMPHACRCYGCERCQVELQADVEMRVLARQGKRLEATYGL